MVEPLNTKPIVGKLLEKTRDGRVGWEARGGGYMCSLDEEYFFLISRIEDSILLSMNDKMGNEIFQEVGREEIYYANPADQERFELLRDLFELARRKAVNADEKIADAFSSLEKI
jgi:hypothetical protein